MGLATKSIIVHPRYRHTLPAYSHGEPVSFSDLPLSCIHLVASLLDAKDLIRFEACSKLTRFDTICNVPVFMTILRIGLKQPFVLPRRAAASDDRLWRHLCRSKFAVPLGANPPSWKDLYR